MIKPHEQARDNHSPPCFGRVLALVGEGSLDPARPGGDEVYRVARRVAAWGSLLGPEQTMGVEARVSSCTDVPSALLARARVRDAVCDAVSDARRAPMARQAMALPTSSATNHRVDRTVMLQLAPASSALHFTA